MGCPSPRCPSATTANLWGGVRDPLGESCPSWTATSRELDRLTRTGVEGSRGGLDLQKSAVFV
eukprot:30918-Pelagococcus_subviridis.AAC.46